MTGCSRPRTCSRVGRDRQPDRCAAAGPLAPARRDGLPRPGDAGAARRPVVLPGLAASAVTARGGAARRAGRPTAGRVPPSPGWCRPRRRASNPGRAQVVGVQLAAGVAVDMAALTPALLATLKHAASMPNPAFYDRQRRRFSTWGVPRFLHSFDETLDGRLVLPRGLAGLCRPSCGRPAARWRSTTGARRARRSSSCSPRRCAMTRPTPSPTSPIMTMGCWSRRPGRARP